jgi:hypothetical protein
MLDYNMTAEELLCRFPATAQKGLSYWVSSPSTRQGSTMLHLAAPSILRRPANVTGRSLQSGWSTRINAAHVAPLILSDISQE